MINLDGEYGGDAPMQFHDLRQHINVVANVAEIPNEAISSEMTPELQRMEKDFIRDVDKVHEVESNK